MYAAAFSDGISTAEQHGGKYTTDTQIPITYKHS